MKQTLAVVLWLVTGLVSHAASADTPKLTGTWEAARPPDDERVYLVLKDMGKAEIVAEYDFTLPGQPGKSRGRSTTFGQWTVKGNEVIVSYAKVQDRLRYAGNEPLAALGRTGSAPALKPVGKANPKSKLGAIVLWKAPHDYRVKESAPPPPGTGAPGSLQGAEPVK
jgi:hypothetical protein